MAEFRDLYYQGEDQAKAAIKGGKTFSSIPYLLFIGPYWTNITYGPFNSAQLDIRTHICHLIAVTFEKQQEQRGDLQVHPFFANYTF